MTVEKKKSLIIFTLYTISLVKYDFSKIISFLANWGLARLRHVRETTPTYMEMLSSCNESISNAMSYEANPSDGMLTKFATI